MTQKPRVKIKRLPDRPGDTGGYNWDHGSLVFEVRTYRKQTPEQIARYSQNKKNKSR